MEKPIAYASRSLAPAVQKYSHVENEGLVVIYRVKRFHQYLWSRPFTVQGCRNKEKVVQP